MAEVGQRLAKNTLRKRKGGVGAFSTRLPFKPALFSKCFLPAVVTKHSSIHVTSFFHVFPFHTLTFAYILLFVSANKTLDSGVKKKLLCHSLGNHPVSQIYLDAFAPTSGVFVLQRAWRGMYKLR